MTVAIEAFGGAAYHITDTPGLTRALTEALASGKLALIGAVIDPTAGTVSGHIQSFKPAQRCRPAGVTSGVRQARSCPPAGPAERAR